MWAAGTVPAFADSGNRAIPATGLTRLSDANAARRAAVHVALLRYLAKHPNASDAPVGICAWWLPEEGVIEEVDLVEQVLSAMAERGLIRRVQLADGTFVYRAVDSARNSA